VTLIH
ncbi:ferrous iron transport protein B, partial [Vibrio parahaemolyticus V-223/04]